MSDHFDSLAESELAVSPPPEPDTLPTDMPGLPRSNASRAKSPPLAFAKTSNDALIPLTTPSPHNLPDRRSASLSPSLSAIGPLGSPSGNEAHMQNVIHCQSIAMDKLHDAFAAERKAWRSERDSLYRRIGALEQLLKTRDHHSPAKSPAASPSITSPPTKPFAVPNGTHRLPSIAEHENIPPLSHRRDGAPRSIRLPGARMDSTESGVSFTNEGGQLMVEEVPISPPTTARGLSPLPPNNLNMAGHTPLRSTRVPTPPPENMTLAGVEDTPTRNNTHINTLLTQRQEQDEDVALKGPLNMPELPNKPDGTNFTLDALAKRLEEVARSPDERTPTIFKVPTPGVASPNDDPVVGGRSIDHPHSDSDSGRRSTNVRSPESIPLSQQDSHDAKLHRDLEQGGIKLKKKPSFNFGQPLGQLTGFPRRLS